MIEKKTIRKYVPRVEDVIKIEVLDMPTKFEKDEGLYRWRFMTDNQLMDIVTLKKSLEDKLPGKSERILDRLQNMRKVYINLHTGEVSS